MGKLRNKLLVSAVLMNVMMAIAYMSAVAWVIYRQSLEHSNSVLQRSAIIVAEELAEKKVALQAASRQLALQNNLGSTIWRLSHYAEADIDRETAFNSYQTLAEDAYRAARSASASKVTIYDSDGALIAFALSDGDGGKAGFVERHPTPRFQLATLTSDQQIDKKNWQRTATLGTLGLTYGNKKAWREEVHYAFIDGQVALESIIPVSDDMFDAASGKNVLRQRGLVVMVQPLDQNFVSQLSRLTDADINIFSTQGLSSGSVPGYPKADWHDTPETGTSVPSAFDEIAINGVGYYQSMIPLYSDKQLVGSIAALRSKEVVRKDSREIIQASWLIAAAGLLLAIPLAWYFATAISRPLRVLSRIFLGVAESGPAGVLNHQLRLLHKEREKRGEMGDLTRSFIAMHDAVNQKIGQINEINASLERTVAERTAALAAKEQESRTLIENSPDTVARYDRQCCRIYVNAAFGAQTEGGVAALLGKKPSEVPGGIDAQLYEDKVREVFASGEDGQFELRWRGTNGNEVCSHIRMTAEKDWAGNVVTVLAVGRDITERLEFEETIWKQANFDALTDLPNRHMFLDRLDREAKLSYRSGLPMALLLIDLDRFKEVNDTMGHDKGDLLLLEAARRISSCVRESDTVSRLGGDEFTIILSKLEDVSSIDRIAQNINKKLSEPFVIDGNHAFISASIGITLFPSDATDLDVLFKNADQAMYLAKNAGRNRYSYFTPHLQEAAQQRLRLTNDLRLALAGEQFEVHYQPIVELASGNIFKAEALIRWRHPERGMISPVDFIPLAEETGLIVPIGDWVFREAVHQVKQWRGKYHASFQISVNKSPVQIRHDDGDHPWPDYLIEHGLSGQCIAIEITEGLLLNAEANINDKLLAFRDAGIQVSLDDFGTGYSSLSYLKKFDIDYLKIDRSFVKHLGSDANDLALCEAIIVMAHKLGLKVIAEGVETETQRVLLRDAGCDFAQGYLYSKPVPPEVFEKLLQTGLALDDSATPAPVHS